MLLRSQLPGAKDLAAKRADATVEMDEPKLAQVLVEQKKSLRDDPHIKALGLNGLNLLYGHCTPLALAAVLGDQPMVKHILRRQTRVMWKWGPVTQYETDLHGIDSSGEGGNDLMELICQLDAREATQRMILDTFIDGLIWKLFKQKWCAAHAPWGRLCPSSRAARSYRPPRPVTLALTLALALTLTLVLALTRTLTLTLTLAPSP